MLEKKKFTVESDILIDNAAKNKIIRHTCQLFSKGGPYGYSPYASGVCVFISGNYFVLTAAHVSEIMQADQTLYVKGDGRFIPINGIVQESDTDKDSKVDLAYIKLDEDIVQFLKFNNEFLAINKIKGRHSLLDAANYMVLGFPVKNIRMEDGLVSTGASYFMVSPSKPNAYDYYKFDPNKVIALDFAGKGEVMISGARSKRIEDPYGISGCGLWLISITQTGGDLSIEYSLVGVMVGGLKGKYHIIYGNRIDILLARMNEVGDIKIQIKKSQ